MSSNTYCTELDLSGFSDEIREAAQNPPMEVPEHVRSHLEALLRRCAIAQQNGMDKHTLHNLEQEIEELVGFIRGVKVRQRAESLFDRSFREQTENMDAGQLMFFYQALAEQHRILVKARSFKHASLVSIKMACVDALLFERYNGMNRPDTDPDVVDHRASRNAQEQLRRLYADYDEATEEEAPQERLWMLEEEIQALEGELLELGVLKLRSY